MLLDLKDQNKEQFEKTYDVNKEIVLQLIKNEKDNKTTKTIAILTLIVSFLSLIGLNNLKNWFNLIKNNF